MTTDVYTPMRYGWSHVYWMQIDSIPIVWAERALAKTLPTNFTAESASLVIDGSARIGSVVDRDKGIGVGFPLSFKLLDSATMSGYMTRPTVVRRLTATLNATGTTATIDDSTSLVSPVWIGKEYVTFSGSTATTLTGMTRGGNGVGLATPHTKGSGASTVTMVPRSWQGRLVTLYAQPIDPTGYAPGTTWEDTSEVIWRGYLQQEPLRSADGDGWEMSALPVDRLLARPLAATLSGVITSTESRFEVMDDGITLALISYTAAGVSALEKAELTPFTDAGFVTGDLISMSQANAAIKTSWDAWVVASGNAAVFGTMIFKMILNPWGAGSTYVIDPVNGDVTPYIIVKPSALSWAVVSNWFNQPYNTVLSPQLINNSDQLMILGTRYRGSVYDQGANGDGGGHSFPAVGIKFDQPPGTIPNGGVIVADSGKWSFTGSSYATTTGTTIFTGLGFLGSAPPGSLVEGQSVQLSFANTGNMSTVLLAMLHSSGENALRNTYDTLPSTSGLGLPTSWVDDETISTALVAGYWAMFNLEAGPGRRSIGDAVCSSLALAGIAIAPAADSQRLTVIYTTASVSGASVTITDAMLISLNGVVADVGKIEPPNSVVVTLNSNGAEESEIQVNDVDRIASEGAVRAEFTLSAIGGADVTKAVMSWGATRLVGDAHASTVTLAVAPWVLLQVGDAVNLALTNPSLWDVDTGTAGVSATGRVIGRELELSTGIQTLTVLIDGESASKAICPSAPVTTWAGTAAAPTTIDLPQAYYTIMFDAYTNRGGTYLRLLHYEPGEGAEGVTQYYDISGVADTGSVCRLTVNAVGGGSILTAFSYLTWPESANDDAWQAQWMHATDGSRWV
jgi:hypothetical protein